MRPFLAGALLVLVAIGPVAIVGDVDAEFDVEGSGGETSADDVVSAEDVRSTEAPYAHPMSAPPVRLSERSTRTPPRKHPQHAEWTLARHSTFGGRGHIGVRNGSAQEAEAAARCAERVARVRTQEPCLLLHVDVALWLAEAPANAQDIQRPNCSSAVCSRSTRPAAASRWTPLCLRSASTHVQCLRPPIESDHSGVSGGRYARLSVHFADGQQLELFFNVQVTSAVRLALLSCQ